MNKMYYVSYETAKEKLNLLSENENSDRITLAYCNQFVRDAVLEDDVFEPEPRYLEAIVLKIFKKLQESRKSDSSFEMEMSGVYSAVKDSLFWA